MLDVRLGSFGNPSLTRQGGRDPHAGTNIFRASRDAAMHNRRAGRSQADCNAFSEVCAAMQQLPPGGTRFEIVMLGESLAFRPAFRVSHCAGVFGVGRRDRAASGHYQGARSADRASRSRKVNGRDTFASVAGGARTGRLRDYRRREEVVPGGGFEPPTRGFSIHCSTN